MNRIAFAAALLCAVAATTTPVWAQQPSIQMLPPTPLNSTNVCPSGTQQVLSYSGAPTDGSQAGINCTPVTTDAEGDLAASGYVQMGNSTAPCDAAHAGSIRYNAASNRFQTCNGGGTWQALGGGLGNLHQSGGQSFYCDPGYTITAFQFNCGCSNNAIWFECQPQ